MTEVNPFERLVGEELNVVAFVMDYVEFHFNGPLVRALSDPIVSTSSGQVQFPAPDSRDALCSLIRQKVSRATLREGHSLEFSFVSGDRLTIPLSPGSYRGPEALHWLPSGGQLSVW